MKFLRQIHGKKNVKVDLDYTEILFSKSWNKKEEYVDSN